MPELIKRARLRKNKPGYNGSGAFNPVPAILVLAWPVVLEMTLHTFVWIFDTAMVMRLGACEASAVEYGDDFIRYCKHPRRPGIAVTPW